MNTMTRVVAEQIGRVGVTESRTLDMVRSFTQSEQAADPVALAEPGCIAAGQRLAGPLIES
jgi:hypothetical protein